MNATTNTIELKIANMNDVKGGNVNDWAKRKCTKLGLDFIGSELSISCDRERGRCWVKKAGETSITAHG